MSPSPAKLGPVVAVVVFSDAPQELAAWYQRLFVLQRFLDGSEFIGLSAGSFTLFVQRSSEGHTPGVGGIRPHFQVENCRETVDLVVKSGGKVLLPPTDTGHEYVAGVTDREGNPLGLLQPKR